MEKRGGGTHKAPLFYIKSGTTEPRSTAHEIHTPGGTLICIPQTSGQGIPPVASRARMRTVRAIVSTSDAKRRVEADSKRAKRARRATSERSERVCAARRIQGERTFARVTTDPHGERVSASARQLGPDQQSPTALPRYLRQYPSTSRERVRVLGRNRRRA